MTGNKFKKIAGGIRLAILDTVARAGKGHLGGAFSCVDILVALYFGKILRYDTTMTQWKGRDRFILSKGHAAIALYAVLAEVGFFNTSELTRFNDGGMLGEHPDNNIPGVEIGSGSLGHGLGIGSGMALAAKKDQLDYRTVVLLGDGECYEGSVWEAMMFAAHHLLNNLVAIIDRNGLCIHGATEEINRLDPLATKIEAFGWDVREINGHDFAEIFGALNDLRNRNSSKPLAILAHTIKGKGVSFMENQASWHHGGLDAEKFKQAQSEAQKAVEDSNL